MSSYEKPDPFIAGLWFIIKWSAITIGAIAVIYLGFTIVKSALRQTLEAHYEENGAPAGSPYAIKQTVREMDNLARKVSVGEGLDRMIEARRQGVDLSTIADEGYGANQDAGVENYVFHQYAIQYRIGSARMNQLLDKIAAEGRPTVGQLAGYQEVGFMCSYKLQEDCQAWNELMACEGHCVGNGPMTRFGTYDMEMCLVPGPRMDVNDCLK